MLGATELIVGALLVLVAALVLRLRQHEPAAVAQLGHRLADARAELVATEERVTALRDELTRGDVSLAPLREQRAALEAELVRVRTELERERAELETAGRALAEQRAQRAEAEAALRAAEQGIARTAVPPAPAGDRERPPSDVRSAAIARVRTDLAALVAAQELDPALPEEPITATGGAVRPTDALPPEVLESDDPVRHPGVTGEERSA